MNVIVISRSCRGHYRQHLPACWFTWRQPCPGGAQQKFCNGTADSPLHHHGHHVSGPDIRCVGNRPIKDCGERRRQSVAVEGGIGGDVPRVAVGAGVAAQRGESTVPFVLVPSAPVPARQAFQRRDALGMQNPRPVPGALGVCPHTNVDAVGSGAQRLPGTRLCGRSVFAEVFAEIAGPRVSPGSFSVALSTPFLRLRAGDQSVRMEHHKFAWAHGCAPAPADECA